MIIQGDVYTADGPVAAGELQPGARLPDRHAKARALTAVETAEVTGALRFKRNSGAVFSADTAFLTAAGRRVLADGEKVTFLLPNGRRVEDTAVISPDETATGYKLAIDGGADVFVNGYNAEV